MQILMTSTNRIVLINGGYCRVWRGQSSLGTRCLVFVSEIDADNPAHQDWLEAEMKDMSQCPEVVQLQQLLAEAAAAEHGASTSTRSTP